VMTLEGKAHRFTPNDDINTDYIISGRYKFKIDDMNELAKHVMEDISPDFARSVAKGDFIVAGRNFGCGSSREQATAVVKQLGIRYVVAESMARIYMRNCVALGLYPVLSRGSSGLFDEGAEIEIDFDKGEVRNPKTGKKAPFEPLSGGSLEIVNAGGILAMLKKRIGK